ncbi:MAG: hypothetical protein LBQ86_07920 [Holophagales bacterium]|jgi:hypothetical protein|nr:hypothetical protein [Holophagales bacterium]
MLRIALLAAFIAIPAMAQTITIQPPPLPPLKSAAETKTFALRSGGQLKISNMFGSVKVSAWDKDEVVLKAAFKPNIHDEYPRIEAESDSDLLELTVKYPPTEEKEADARKIKIYSSDAGACDMELKAPRRIVCNIETISGAITLCEITGKNTTSAINGEIVFEKINGNIKASVVNGTISGSIQDIEDNLNLSTVDGKINVKLLKPNGNLRASSVIGRVKIAGELQKGLQKVNAIVTTIHNMVCDNCGSANPIIVEGGMQRRECKNCGHKLPKVKANKFIKNNNKNIRAKFDGNAKMTFSSVNGSITIR